MLAIIAAMALAQSAPTAARQSEIDSLCASIGGFAENVMTARQKNVQLTKAMEVLRQVENEEYRAFFRRVVLAAYEKPLYYSPEYKAQEVAEFRNQWETTCYREAMEG